MDATTTPTAARIERLVPLLKDQQIDLLLAAPSADLVYLAGYAGHASERPTLLAVTAAGGSPVMLVPRLEAPRLAERSDVAVVAYEETDDPFERLKAALENTSRYGSIAISDQAWAAVLLGLQGAYPASSFIPASRVLRPLRMRKEAGEIDLLVQAGRRADAAFQRVVDVRFEGRTESQVAAELNEILAGEGLERADWGPIVAGGPNSASAHHITGGRVLQEGDAVILDFGGVFGGYQADITRTVHVGTPTEDFARVYDTVRRAQELAFAEASPGIPAQDVDRAARRAIEAAGYGGYLVHRTGHGLGLDTHEEPYIVEGNSLLLEPGMVFSIEPGAYLPGRFGVRIEDTVAVMPEGPRRLNEATRELVLVQ